MRGVLLVLAGLAILCALVGIRIFLNPETPPLDRIESGSMETIDERTGVYEESSGGQRLIAPDLVSGWRMYGTRLPSWAHYDPDGERTDEPGSLRFTDEGYERIDEGGEALRARRTAPQPFEIFPLAVTTDVELAGWLFIPTARPQKLIVIVHGSGSSDRRNAYYLLLAQHLVRSGAAVILPDKRGSGRSGGDWRTASLDTLARDAAVFMEAGEARFPGIETAYVGVSQGGSIAPLAAVITEADEIVIIGSAMVAYYDQLRTEISNDVRAEGIPAWLNPAVTTAFAARARGRYPEFWRQNGAFDTIEALDEWGGRAFIAYGELDEYDNVPVSRSVERLEARFGERSDVIWEVYPEVGHGLLTPDHEFHSGFLADLMEFLGLEPSGSG